MKNQPKKISILGATSWGVTLSNILSENIKNIVILTRNDLETKTIQKEKTIKRDKLYKLNNSIRISNNYEEEIIDSDILILAVPSISIRENLNLIKDFITNEKIIISAIKGFEYKSKKLISDYILEEIGIKEENIGVISGPNISSEIYDGLPATTVIGINKKYEEIIREIFNTDKFRAYSSNDLKGIEVGGILKNIFAIGAGIIQEYQLGTNAMAAYITRSLHEMNKVILFFGGKESSTFGNSGLGDLITTCFNGKSRNNQLGSLIAKGIEKSLAQKKINGIIEGINSTKIIKNLLIKEQIETPIINEIYKVLFEDKNPKLGIKDLMDRAYSKE
tara:strand:- start:1306 stop:2307 length:1002 start_codon:yes stop_codon:yes gene_type:complete